MAELETPSTLPLALRSIYLRESSTRFRENFDPLKPGQPLQMQAKFAPIGYLVNGDMPIDGGEVVPRSYTFLTQFEFNYFAGPFDTSVPIESIDTSDPVAKITAQIGVDYLVTPGETTPTEDRLHSWANSAALVHAWPYWREFAHNTMMRMNLPVMMIPLLVTTPAAALPTGTNQQKVVEQKAPTAKKARAKVAPSKGKAP